MHFEWDIDKAKQNLKKHKVSFEEAITIFYDPFSATFNDPGHSAGEERYITIGLSSKNRLIVVSHTDRNDNIRLISARPATTHERKRHEE
ncbi:MAG: BrnT family toxin [Deltaproteobacteria bacterium]|nr:BrnT family toxin [Deltaproteobacteria bacterium]